jgi:hypothetical protein
MKKLFVFFLALVLAGVATAAYYLHPRFESDPPDVTVTPASDAVGLVPIEITVSDKGTGLRSVTATLSAGGIEHTLVSEQYSTPVPEKRITLEAAKIAGFNEGPAVLPSRAMRRCATRSRRAVFRRFTSTHAAHDRAAGRRPPSTPEARARWSMSPTRESGVNRRAFFPGFRGRGEGQSGCELRASRILTRQNEAAALKADKAATRANAPFHELKNVKYRKSTIATASRTGAAAPRTSRSARDRRGRGASP